MEPRTQSSSIYDNEAIGTIILEKAIRQLEQITLAKTLLVLPILLHDPIVKRLSTKTKYRSVDEFLIKERLSIGDVNGRFQSMLPLTINSISILLDLKLITQKGIVLKAEPPIETSKKIAIGTRSENILKVLPKASFFFNENDASIYLKLNITL